MPSPLPKKQNTMTFGEAMNDVVAKRRIHKLEWDDRGFFGFLDEGKLRLHRPDGKIHDWIISEGDLNGDDWITI